jgi:riboflavin synthase
VGTISKVVRRGDNWYIEVDIPETLDRYVIPEGSIAVDGISLTVAGLEGTNVGLSIIPHTFKNTTLSRVKVGNSCNIETDLIGKYLEKWLNNSSDHSDKQQITSEWLQSKGF